MAWQALGTPGGCLTMSSSACARSCSSGVPWCCSRAWCPPCLVNSAAACGRGEGESWLGAALSTSAQATTSQGIPQSPPRAAFPLQVNPTMLVVGWEGL